MGGGPDDEHMLIVLWNPEPKDVISKIKEKFPYIEITYFQLKSTRANNVPEAEKSVPKGGISSMSFLSYSLPVPIALFQEASCWP